MTSLILSDLIRLQRRPLYLLPIAIVAFFGLLPLLFVGLSHWNADYVGFARVYSGYPKGIWALLRMAQYLMPVAVAILAAGAAGEDYSVGSLKIVLARASSRCTVFTAKCISIFSASLGLLLSVVIVVALTGWLARLAIGEAYMESPFVVTDVLRVIAFYALEAAYLSLLSVLFVTITRSQTTGIVFAIIGPFLLRLLTFLPGGRFLPAVNLDVVEMALMPGNRFSSAEMESVLGGPVHPMFFFVFVVLVCAALFMVSLAIFER